MIINYKYNLINNCNILIINFKPIRYKQENKIQFIKVQMYKQIYTNLTKLVKKN